MFFLYILLIVEVDLYIDIFNVVIGKISIHLILWEDLIAVGDIYLIDDNSHYFLGIPPEVQDQLT